MAEVEWNQKGYVGSRMSKRAVQAYKEGEKPKSKWNKKEILREIEEYFGEDLAVLFNKWKIDDLKNRFLEYSSWHHTGKFARATQFYILSKKKIRKHLEYLII